MSLLLAAIGSGLCILATRILDNICRGYEPDQHIVGALLAGCIGLAYLLLAIAVQREEHRTARERMRLY